jgi:hypothetical protein
MTARMRRISLAGGFCARHGRTGKGLGTMNLGSRVASGPMTYAVGGQQYAAAVSGNSLFTFALRK